MGNLPRQTLMTVLVAAVSVATRADDWPQWMGPGRDNVWRETEILERFPAGGPKVLWRTPIAGGYAGPAMAAGRVFVTDFVAEAAGGTEAAGDSKGSQGRRGTERVLCLDANTGAILWRHEEPAVYTISYPAGPRCTPLVDGDRVYTLGAEGRLLCLRVVDGAVEWSRDLKEDYRTKSATWGYASHPLLDGDRLICVVGTDVAHAVAFDKHDGREIWKTGRAPEQGYSPPVILEAAGVRQLVLMKPDGIYAVEPETGKLLWESPYDADNGSIIMQPVRIGDYLYVGGFQEKNLLLRLAQEAPGAEVVWRNKRQHGISAVNVQPFVLDGHLCGYHEKGDLRVVAIPGGEIVWSGGGPLEGRPKGSGTAFIVRAPAAAAGGPAPAEPAGESSPESDRFFLFTETGDLVIARLSPAGYTELDRAHLLEPTNTAFGREVVWCPPAYAERSIVVRNDREIIRVSLAADSAVPPEAARGRSPPAREIRRLVGWTVLVDRRLLDEQAAPAGGSGQATTSLDRALELLEDQLEEIVRVVPARAVEALRKVPLFVSPEYPGVGAKAEYHPSADWLAGHGRDPAMARGVEFTNVRIFEAETRRMPNFALHELAHAYHHRVLPAGFGNAEVAEAFARARDAGLYDRVERRDSEGRPSFERSYAMTNPQEFFAESSEACFARNDFFPFDRQELVRHDPATLEVIEVAWGVAAARDAGLAGPRPMTTGQPGNRPDNTPPGAPTPRPQAGSPAAAVTRPSVILFIADDVSAADLGCYGHPMARTPNIDRLAATGRRFDACFLTASSCSPSRASIITGRYPHNTGRACELHLPIDPRLPWFPRLLREAGYYTALVGKNHMASDPPRPGERPQPKAFDLVDAGTAPGNRGGHAHWVRTVRERPPDRPFFFWFAALDAHRGWDGDADWDADRYGPRHDPDSVIVPPELVGDPATRADLASYHNEVTRFDHFVGEVVAELARQDMLDDTLILVMADNGRPFPRAKTRLHDGGMRTPLVVHWPRGLARPGVPTTSLASAVDLAPTILAAAGIEPPSSMQGVSLLPLLADPGAIVRRHAYSEHNWHDYEAHGRAVRSDGWLYVRNRRPAFASQGPADSVRSPAHRSLLAAADAGGLSAAQADVLAAPRAEEELFDTANDPEQLENLAADPSAAERLARMRGLLDAWAEATHDSAPERLSVDEHDRTSGDLLRPKSPDKHWYRGTPPGSDRDAAAVEAAGPR